MYQVQRTDRFRRHSSTHGYCSTTEQPEMCSACWQTATGRVTLTFHGLLSYLLLTAPSFETMELSVCICRAFLVTNPTLERPHLVRENEAKEKCYSACFQPTHAQRNNNRHQLQLLQMKIPPFINLLCNFKRYQQQKLLLLKPYKERLKLSSLLPDQLPWHKILAVK